MDATNTVIVDNSTIAQEVARLFVSGLSVEVIAYHFDISSQEVLDILGISS